MDSNSHPNAVPFHELAARFKDQQRAGAHWSVEVSAADGTQYRGPITSLTNGGHFFKLEIRPCETRTTEEPAWTRCKPRSISERVEGYVALAMNHGYVITTLKQAEATDHSHDLGLYIEITVSHVVPVETPRRDGRSFVIAPMTPAPAAASAAT